MSAEDRKDVAKIKAELIAQFDQKDQTLISEEVLCSEVGVGQNNRKIHSQPETTCSRGISKDNWLGSRRAGKKPICEWLAEGTSRSVVRSFTV